MPSDARVSRGQRYVVLAGVVLVVAFLVVAKTASQTRKGKEIRDAATAVPSATAGPGGGGGANGGGGALGGGGGGPAGGGDGLGGPAAGPPGKGDAVLTGAIRRRITFQQVSCISSPSTKNGVSATGIADPMSVTPVFLSVTTDGSTINPMLLRFGQTQTWSDGQLKAAPVTRRTGKTVTFTGTLLPQGKKTGTPVKVAGTLTCGKISTVIG